MAYRRKSYKRRAPRRYRRARGYRRSRRGYRRVRRASRGKRGMMRIPRVIPKMMRPEFKWIQWENNVAAPAASYFLDVTKLVGRGTGAADFLGNRFHALRLDMRVRYLPYEECFEDLTAGHLYVEKHKQYGFWCALVRCPKVHQLSAPANAINILGSLYDVPSPPRQDPRYWFKNVDHNTNNDMRIIKKWIVQIPANSTMAVQQDDTNPLKDVVRPQRASWNYTFRTNINKTVVYDRADTGITPHPVRNALYLIMWPLNYDSTYNPALLGQIWMHAKLTYTDS